MKVGEKVWVLCEVVNLYRKEDLVWVEVGSKCGRVWVNASDCRLVEPPVVPDLSTMGVEVVSDLGSQGVKPSAKQPTEAQKLADEEDPFYEKWEEPVVLTSAEPLGHVEANTKTANDQLRQSLMDYPFGEPPNDPEIPDSSSEPMRASFEADLIQRHGWNQSYFGRNENQYFDSSVEMAWQAYQAGAKYQSSPLAPSPCVDGIKVGDAVRFVWPGHKWHRTEGTIISTMGDPNIFVDIKEYPYRFKSDCGAFERWCSANQLERIDKADPINPSHYKQGGIECIEAIKAATGDGFIGYVWGNVLKYLWRWPKKGGVDDLKKARWYLDRLIKEVGE